MAVSALGQDDDTSTGQLVATSDGACSTGGGWIRQYTASLSTLGETAVTWEMVSGSFQEHLNAGNRGSWLPVKQIL